MSLRHFTLLLVFVAGAAAAQSDAGTDDPPSSRRGEIEWLSRTIEATHPEGPRLTATAEWRDAAAALGDRAESLAPDDYAIELIRLVARLGDGHSLLFVPAVHVGAFGRRLPVTGRAFDEGWWITEAGGEGAPLLGARLATVNGVPAAQLMRNFSALLSRDNEAWGHALSAFLLASGGVLRAAGVEGSSVEIVAERGDGERVTVVISPAEGPLPELTALETVPTDAARWAAEAETRNFIRPIPGRNAAYVGLTIMSDEEGAPFTRFTEQVAALADDAAVERLVIDLRSNSGGNNFLCEPLRHVLAMSRFNRPGGLVILIGPRTFSAAQNFATRMERETVAIFVGEPTGGRPNHFGDATEVHLPYSGLPVHISTLRWQDMPPMDRRPWIMPDILVPERFDDWRVGRDRALDTALAYRPGPDAPAAPSIAPWERPSQSQAWRPFWREAPAASGG